MNNKIILSLLLLLVVTGLVAETHEAHEHGAVSAQIELGATEGHIQFELTGMDFVGFGYIAESDVDIEFVHETVEAVTNNELVKIKKKIFSSAKIHHIDVEEPGHDDHDADHEDYATDSDDHDHGAEHTDYVITVEIEYSDTSKLKSFDITSFFELFPSVEEVEWVTISDSGQSAGEATPKAPVISVN